MAGSSGPPARAAVAGDTDLPDDPFRTTRPNAASWTIIDPRDTRRILVRVLEVLPDKHVPAEHRKDAKPAVAMDIRIVRGTPDDHDLAALLAPATGAPDPAPRPGRVTRAAPYASPRSWQTRPGGAGPRWEPATTRSGPGARR
jgi:hypothetical protein